MSSSDCEKPLITILFQTAGIFFIWFDWDFVGLLIWGFLGEGGSVILCFFYLFDFCGCFIYLLLILFLEVFCPKSGFNVKLFYEGQSKLEDMLES